MIKYINCNILSENGWIKNSSFCTENGKFKNIAKECKCDNIVDLQGQYVLPGIVDIHGDSFERCIAPRPGVHLPLKSALYENDNNLLSAGITTFFYSITDSFESGLRSRQNAKEMIEFITTNTLRCRSLIHIRHEVANTKEFEDLLQWIQDGSIDLLSINDHLPRLEDEKKLQRYKNGIKRRMVMSEEEIEEFIDSLQGERKVGEKQIEQLICYAKKYNIALASHDDDTIEKVNTSVKRGVQIAEFPMDIECAKLHKDSNIYTLFGAPNLIRGGSHVGALGAYDAAQEGLLDILCSDYHYPSLFLSPFKIESLGLESLDEAWKKVSLLPAKAVGLENQIGSIKDEKEADFLVLNSLKGELNSIEKVFIQGEEKLKF
ncbi:MAG: alpha-D-ribose 1-methylphosphonate 5-triphosphate diphosphatase [Campylobacterota bacterium]|nr:alpha-D-ribose 1-methylphosphonate 5-triphosphate diphosphatase [Campylobacterota bacterium]